MGVHTYLGFEALILGTFTFLGKVCLLSVEFLLLAAACRTVPWFEVVFCTLVYT